MNLSILSILFKGKNSEAKNTKKIIFLANGEKGGIPKNDIIERNKRIKYFFKDKNKMKFIFIPLSNPNFKEKSTKTQKREE